MIAGKGRICGLFSRWRLKWFRMGIMQLLDLKPRREDLTPAILAYRGFSLF
jgi:hypothetical protein